MQLIFRPIDQWTGELARSRRSSPFKADYQSTLKLLDQELTHLGTNVVACQLAVKETDISLAGTLRAGTTPIHPGVILSFESRHGLLSYPCDTFSEWKANLRAVALALEHLRTVNRYGVTKRGEQYRGWQKLPSPDVVMARERLRDLTGITVQSADDLREAFRLASRKTHPDHGGTGELFAEVVAAREILAGSLR